MSYNGFIRKKVTLMQSVQFSADSEFLDLPSEDWERLTAIAKVTDCGDYSIDFEDIEGLSEAAQKFLFDA